MSKVPNDELVRLLVGANRIVVFTGAGISTGSGIPDYRGPEGVWKTRKPVYFQEFMESEQRRKDYWQQKCEDWAHFGSAQPNAAHQCLAQLEEAGRLTAVITQNIDGLHLAGGNSAEKVVEIHGCNREAACLTCGKRQDAAPLYEAYAQNPVPPLCSCGGYLKPATISFGQGLDEATLERAQSAILECDLVLALGTTLSVQPAASLPLFAARQRIPYVIINKGPTEHDGMPLVALRIEGDVVVELPPAVDAALLMSS